LYKEINLQIISISQTKNKHLNNISAHMHYEIERFLIACENWCLGIFLNEFNHKHFSKRKKERTL